MNEAIGWRWAFLIQPPIVVVNGLLVFFVVKIRQKKDGSFSPASNRLFRRLHPTSCDSVLSTSTEFWRGYHGLEQRCRHHLFGDCWYQLRPFRILGFLQSEKPSITPSGHATTNRCCVSAQLLLCQLCKYQHPTLRPSLPSSFGAFYRFSGIAVHSNGNRYSSQLRDYWENR